MKTKIVVPLLICFLINLFSIQSRAEDTSMRELIASCTYGVLAGTLVGVASLAFTDKPGENLQRVARGASIGLYLGIGLGLYVIYGVPGPEDQMIEGEPGYEGEGGLPPLEGARVPRYQIFPILNEQYKIEGIAATGNIWSW